MALEVGSGAIQWNAADGVNTTYSVTSLSFEPKALMFVCLGLGSATSTSSETIDARKGVGFAVSTSSRRCVASHDQDAADPTNCSTGARNDAVLATVSDGAFDGRLDLDALLSNGFRLIVDDAAPVNLTVLWFAWGGSDITVAVVGDFSEPGSGGTQNLSVTGFTSSGTDQVVLWAGVQSTAAFNSAESEASGLYVGFATGTGNDCVVTVGNADHSSATADTDGYCQTGELMALIPVAGGLVNMRGTFSTWLTDGFQINILERTNTGRKSIWLAMKGGQWKAGAYTIDATALNNTATVSGLLFAPVGVLLIGRNTVQQNNDVSTATDVIGIGMGTSTSNRCSMGLLSEDGVGVGSPNLTLQYETLLSFPTGAGALDAAYDLNAMNSDGFQVIVDNMPSSPSAVEWQGYLTFGSVSGMVSKSGTESVKVGLTESPRSLLAASRIAENLKAGLTESPRSLIAASRITESLIAGLLDSATISLTLRASDPLPLGLVDAVRNVAVVFVTADAIALALVDAQQLQVFLAAYDGAKISLIDTSRLISTLSTITDALPTGLSEAYRIAVAITVRN